nr:3308_t:CDS:1 [Entrophospora candida]
MLSKSFKSLAFALLIMMIFSNAFIYASPVFEEKRDVNSLEKRAPPDIGKAAFARFGDNDIAKGVVTFIESFDVGSNHRRLVITAVFSDGFTSSNINNYDFSIEGDGSLNSIFSALVLNPPRAKIFDCTFVINGPKVRDLIGKQFVIKLNNKRIGRDKISAI